jgi:DNA-binding MarR family transcriptional regulator
MKHGLKRLPARALTRTDPAPVDNLVSTYVARRELLPLLVDRLLVGVGLTFEEAELMLELFGPWKLGWRVPPCDPEGYVIQKALESVLMNSQPHVSRRVGKLEQKGYVVAKRVARSGILRKAHKVRLTQPGLELTASIWKNYKRLAEKILQGVPPEQRLKHYLVCQSVCAQVRPGDYLEQIRPNQAPEPADNLILLFKMARDVRQAIVQDVLGGTNLTLERADLLVILFLAHAAGNKKVPGESGSGFVPLANIRNSLVHSISPSKFLLSRWLRDLASQGLVEEKSLDGTRKAARLSAKGLDATAPILRKYFALAKDLLRDILPEDRLAHIETNNAIVQAVQPYGKRDSIRRVGDAMRTTSPSLWIARLE